MEIAAEVGSRVGPKATGTAHFGGDLRRHGTGITRTWIFPHLQVSGRFLPHASAPRFQASYGEVSLATPLFLFFPFMPSLLFKRMDRIAHRLGRTAQVVGDFFRALSSMRGQQNLTSAQEKGI